ncbi:hypothetical protein TIFTF001_037632 [Ficus carica]|uniref:Uncharacterized protein n=1 Tax=Ficus carica TaxID=3494 RepID=A0AA88E5P0_FICCA|nr:hypothetical protein TIFTF001_037618 [Ficus carica]GMN68577.1 hypothetical protein TIFTF001_037632 [Ficus carica]
MAFNGSFKGKAPMVDSGDGSVEQRRNAKGKVPMVDLEDDQRRNTKGKAPMVNPNDAMNVDQRKSPLIPENPVPLFDSGMLGSSTLIQHGSSHQVQFSSSLSPIALRLSRDNYALW